VTALVGDKHVEAVQFEDGSRVETELVVISCGIRPNAELAKSAGLNVNRAIMVDDQMRTSDPKRVRPGRMRRAPRQIYGLVEPIYEQARCWRTC